MSCRVTVVIALGSGIFSGTLVDQAGAASQVGTEQSLRAQAAALATEITNNTQEEQIAGEHYDEANVKLSLAQARLAGILNDLAVEQRRTKLAQIRVRKTAVSAYVSGDSAAAQFGVALESSVADAGTLNTYAGVATGSLHTALAALQSAEAHLQQSKLAEASTVAQANDAVASAASAQSQAEAAAAQTKSALSSVNSQLATVVAEQEAAAARAAEIRARAADAAARAEAAAQAAAAASVAEAVAGTSAGSAAGAAAAGAAAAASGATAIGAPTLSVTATSTAGNTAAEAAEGFLGVPYVWGGASSAGVDCSGLTMLAWGAAGVSLEHSAWYQYQASTPIQLSELEPGDLLFYYFPADGSDPVTHVAMYVGQGPYGAQTIIQAPETGQNVQYAQMYYYGFVGAGRPK